MDAQEEQQLSRAAKHTEKKSHKLRNVILIIVALLVAGGVGFGIYTYAHTKSAIDHAFKPITTKGFKPARNVASVLKEGKPVSVLLLGTDTGSLNRAYTGRTDSIMIASINPKTKTTTLMSIPRDSMVSIPKSQGTAFQFPQKINAAYEFPDDGKGHPETTISTLQDFLNVPIDFYALINMGGMKTMIDKVGGIRVKSPLTFTYKPSNTRPPVYKFYKGTTKYEYAKDGINFVTKRTMDGKAALAFSRMRYTDPQGDYGRQKRQRLVLTALAKESGKLSSLLTPGFFDTMSDNIQTNLSFDDLVTMASNYKVAADHIKSDHMQGYGYNYNGTAFEIMPTSEKQRVTNKLRSTLGLSAAKTGSRFASPVTNGVYISDNEAQLTADTDAGRTGSSTTASSSSAYSSSTAQP
ncbi:LytR family transcriptional regulator [Periweissella cryptocerci]|uniref:LytR family transcriptional regulator n=1 Tax=Periweissella cryptocerci TaxID=2506420 RepID=A0A4P6YTR9_9LACO|nr:LCP family protein [Periweissella cryptocerci]QBO36057.1 LytR family transcriptional regulator [Periweissella cryptocerci]